MFTGWGLRTLSAHNPAYNPLSYQRGSVWPHDTTLAAAGLWRYGLRDQASELMRAVLEAACAFEGDRLPELFCGFDRRHGMPVPYEEANVPQAWASAAPLLMVQLMLGLVPDAPRNRCFLDPWLPEWLPRMEINGIAFGVRRLNVTLQRRGTATLIERAEGDGIEVVERKAEAPLWGAPIKLT
jgi:glycogen debranching enzyme